MTQEQIPASTSQPTHPLTYRLIFEGSTSSSFRDSFPELRERSAPKTKIAVGRQTIGSANVERLGVSPTVLEGPVLDAAQLAGIVSDLCYRNSKIIRVELLHTGWQA